MQQDDQLLKNFISQLPPGLLESKQVQEMALDAYYSSVTTVLCNSMEPDEVSNLLQRTNDNGGSLDLLRAEVPDFDNKVFEEFTKLIKEKAAHDNIA